MYASMGWGYTIGTRLCVAHFEMLVKRLWFRWGVVLLLLAGAGVALWQVSPLCFAHGEQMSMAESQPYSSPYQPKSLSFAGERVPLELVDVRESLDRELAVAANWHSHIILIIKRANRYFPLIEPILKEEGLPEDFKYLAVAESSLQETAVSPSGAAGLWQFLEATAKDYDLLITEEIDERYHLEKSTRAACRYLKRIKDQVGSWTMAAAAYNAGQNAVSRLMERQWQSSYYDMLFASETARYVFRILALRELIEHPSRYGFAIKPKELYPVIPTHTVQIDTAVTDLAVLANGLGTNYKLLKWLNPWLRTNTLTPEPNQSFSLRILPLKERSVTARP